MRDPRITFRNRELAALLAFLLPGAGHWYQGRRLKAGIYCGGILFLFFVGMILGDWQPVYSQVVSSADNVEMRAAEAKIDSNYSIGYAAQVFVGLPAIPSLIQQTRFDSDAGVINTLPAEIESDFTGLLKMNRAALPVSGRIHLTPGPPGSVVGEFTGQTRDGDEIACPIDGSLTMGRQVYGSPRRTVEIAGLHGVEVAGLSPRAITGTVSRPFVDWYQAPRDTAELDRLHGKLSQNFDIATVFTWVAGLLNLMAIWDAYDGPAYGYGDEEPDEDEDSDKDKDKDKEAAETD